MIRVQSGGGILRENLGDIGVGTLKIVVPRPVPCDIKYSRNSLMISLDLADGIYERHLPTKTISRHPGVAHQVSRVYRLHSPSARSQEKDRHRDHIKTPHH